jgi:Ice-binding-like/Bacterial Ig-like domain (group 3)
MKTRVHGTRLMRAAGMAVALAIGALAVGPTAFAAGPAPVGLGTAAPFAVLAGKPGVTNTGNTTITGNLGIDPAASVTGFPPGTVNGTIHKADAVALQAKKDLVTAYNAAAGRTPVTAVAAGKLGGKTLVGGVYSGGALALTGTLTLDGQNDPNSVWVFQAASSLITASTSKVALIRGASPCNVFWQVTSSATLGSGSTFVGTIMAMTTITMANGVTVNGRALARNGAVTLINDKINNSSCSGASTTGSTKLTYTGTTAAAPGATITLRATLKTSAGAAIAGKTVTFTLHGVTRSAKTNSSGVASVMMTAPTALGSYTIKIAFAGDTTHPRASTSASLRVRIAALPNTATLATTDVPGSGPTPVVFVGILLLAFVVASRLLPRAIRTRRTTSP